MRYLFSFLWTVIFHLVTADVVVSDLLVRASGQDIKSGLGPKLSSGSRILLPGDSDFPPASERWQEYAKPTFSAIVEVTNENDISETIIYANNNSMPFLALGGAHGSITSLEGFQNGIGIRLSKLKNITVSDDGTYATIEGGVTNGEVMRALKAVNKQSATGVCECTGFMGALLGGGHGLLQGHYGMVIDNVIDFRVVMADGSIVNVSDTSDHDYFWALRGAGHNFGIVPSLRYKIYEPDYLQWNYTMMAFSQDKLEAVYEVMNKITARPEHELTNVINYAIWMRSPDIDPNNVLIFFGLIYPIPDDNGTTFTSWFLDLNPLSVQSQIVQYWDLPKLTGNGDDSPICQHGVNNHLRFPIYLDEYNLTATRSAYDLFNNMTAEVTAFKDSMILFEAYSLVAVRLVDWANSGFAWRDTKVLVAPVITYAPDAALDDTAIKFGNRTREILYEGTQGTRWWPVLRVYVNYAFGDETLDQLYGQLGWRTDKLAGIKQKIDPNNRFRWFAPVVR